MSQRLLSASSQVVALFAALATGCGGATRDEGVAAECLRADSPWRFVDTRSAPDAERSRHSAVWTGGYVLIWGGMDPAGRPLSSGFKIDPWTWNIVPMSQQGAPEPRYSHFAAWTGSEMIVWGGTIAEGQDTKGLGVPAVGGGLYDPSTDSWRAIAPGGPGARQCVNISWTGAELFIWGGISETSKVNWDGFLYNPTAEAWRPTPEEGTPTGNCAAQVLATDHEVLVLGGSSGGFEPADTGARYDLVTEKWQSLADRPDLSVVYPPAPAFWTGTEAVFCKHDYACFAYRPMTEQWRALSAAGAPTSRLRSAWAYTGSRLIVFGGDNTDHILGDGGLYQFDDDTWRALPDKCLPSARSDATLTWTDVGAFLWGGHADTRAGGWLLSRQALEE